jgi:hypothetical protein
MAAPTGTWNFFKSGAAQPASLVLATAATGAITGTLNGNPITAVWDEASQVLSFSEATAGGSGANDAGFTINVYSGTLFPPYKTPNGLVSGEGVPLLLAGNFGTGTAGATVGPFNTSGWFATNTVKFKEKEGKESKEHKDGKDGKDGKDKEQKDGKEKEGHLDQLLPLQAAAPVSDAVMASMNADENAPAEVRFATGRSFIPEDERPAVGTAALQS